MSLPMHPWLSDLTKIMSWMPGRLFSKRSFLQQLDDFFFVDPSAELLEKLRTRNALIGIVGLGYVGLPLSLTYAEVGYRPGS